MAEKKEVYVTSDGGGAGLGMIAGILAVVLIGVGLLFFSGVFGPEKKSLDVNVELPKATTPAPAPAAPGK
jgi:hypothetical protein